MSATVKLSSHGVQARGQARGTSLVRAVLVVNNSYLE